MVSLEPAVRKTRVPGRDARTPQREGGGEEGSLTAGERELLGRIPQEIRYVPHPSFDRPETETRLFGEDGQVDVPRWLYFGGPVDELLSPKSTRSHLSRDEEQTLFLRYNYARYRLRGLAEAQRRRCCAARAREMVRWFRRGLDARSDLAEANMGLVLAMAKRSRTPNVEFSELVSEGNLALLRSIERFDVSRGYKFSTYACRAILKSFCRLASKWGRYRQEFPTSFRPELERSDYDVRRHEIRQESAVEALREILSRNHAKLTELEQRIVLQRFGIHGGGRRHTLSEVGQAVGLSNERVRQIQIAALRKIRTALEDGYLSA